MNGLSNTSIPLTCGDFTLGSLTTFCNEGGVSRIAVDPVIPAGTILGPGADFVFCDDVRVSKAGDSISAHPPCPSVPNHCAAFTLGSADVTVETVLPVGFTPGPLFEQQLGDLESILFFAATPVVPISNQPNVVYNGPLSFVGVFRNTGALPITKPFTIALFEILPNPIVNPAIIYNLQRSSVEEGVPVVILQEFIVPFVNPGQIVSWSFTLPPRVGQLFLGIPRYFSFVIDIDNEIREIDESNNTSRIVPVVAT